MKKILKNPFFTFVFGLIIAGSIGVVASTISASNISYKTGTVEGALNNLFDIAENYECVKGSHVWSQEDADNGYVLADFVPSMFAITSIHDETYTATFYYNNSISPNVYEFDMNGGSSIGLQILPTGTSFRVIDNMMIKWSNYWNGNTIYYTVCK